MQSATITAVRELVQRAATDPGFADVLLRNPEVFREEYGLTEEQCNQVRLLAGKGLLPTVVNLSNTEAAASYY
jgi:hypothetical protein